LLSDGRTYVRRSWWHATLAGLAVAAMLLAINLVGERIRERVAV
jgi:ABC-type dipeptide/oligopeptide/nickel transport system permease subunit